MADVINVETYNDHTHYKFFPVSSGCIQFEVRAPNDAHLALTAFPKVNCRMVEVFIGGWRNTKSVIRKNRVKPEKAEVTTNEILSENEFRGFWIQWENGYIRVGYKGESRPFMFWKDDEVSPIRYIGVCTGWGASGSWSIQVSPVDLKTPLKTPKKLDSGELKWVKMIDSKLPPDAMIGGIEYEPIYIARAQHNGSLCPGKYVPSKGKAFVPWGGREHIKEHFEILCGYNAEWIKTSGNLIPENAFIGGTSEVRNEPLYIGRAMYDNHLLTGKVHTLYSTCYLPYKNREIELDSYEILVAPYVVTRSINSDCDSSHINNM